MNGAACSVRSPLAGLSDLKQRRECDSQNDGVQENASPVALQLVLIRHGGRHWSVSVLKQTVSTAFSVCSQIESEQLWQFKPRPCVAMPGYAGMSSRIQQTGIFLSFECFKLTLYRRCPRAEMRIRGRESRFNYVWHSNRLVGDLLVRRDEPTPRGRLINCRQGVPSL